VPLPDAARRGEMLGAFAVTERRPFRPRSMTTRAEERETTTSSNGSKIFINEWLLRRCDRSHHPDRFGEANRGLSAFLLTREMPGFTIGRREEKMGSAPPIRSNSCLTTVGFPRRTFWGRKDRLQDRDGCPRQRADRDRLPVPRDRPGLPRQSIRYARTRKQFGRSIASFQAIQWMIADTAAEIEAANWLTLAAADRKDQGLPFTKEASMAKLVASEMANRAAYRAVQVHGGYGYMNEYKVERLYRDARVTSIYEGPPRCSGSSLPGRSCRIDVCCLTLPRHKQDRHHRPGRLGTSFAYKFAATTDGSPSITMTSKSARRSTGSI